MTTQYSILSVLIRPEIQEKISVGLLLFNANEVYFSYSKNKLQVSKELLSNSSYKILREILENIERKIDFDNSKSSNKKEFKIFKNNISDNTFSTSYISYLSKYSNNVISFTNPKEISLEVNKQIFSSLFRKYIDDIIEAKEELPRVKPVEYIKTHFGDKIEKHYDLNREVTHEHVQNLITPVRIDFAGKNEIDVFAQTVDMEATPVTVANHINSFIQLKTTYNENNVSMKDFIIAKEPDRNTFPKQHDIWNQLRTSNILNYLDLSESEAIITYAEQHGVVPLTCNS
ncbi:hypothetical protein DC498_03460 [Terrimonas sp.]|uniref:hypothetical protein n=1 Tax=Terrimonas sp. TaxID=1914338 RepID=UPI000D50999D|nr:hypothetical protein [Terrimonas sp.]PVD53588.1 hypothetical protein DC498_03460 [Terrimonas sp.]